MNLCTAPLPTALESVAWESDLLWGSPAHSALKAWLGSLILCTTPLPTALLRSVTCFGGISLYRFVSGLAAQLACDSCVAFVLRRLSFEREFWCVSTCCCSSHRRAFFLRCPSVGWWWDCAIIVAFCSCLIKLRSYAQNSHVVFVRDSVQNTPRLQTRHFFETQRLESSN